MRLSTLLVLFFMGAGLAVLGSLGAWQLERLAWKETLTQTIKQRITADPVALDAILALQQTGDDFEYMPVKVRGTFDHEAEVYFYTTSDGDVGWNVYAPLVLEDGRILIVNRGFVNSAVKDPLKRPEGQIEGTQVITGLARRAPVAKSNSFVPDNALQIREFYWKSHTEMTGLMAVGGGVSFVALFVDADDRSNPGGWPKGGATLLSFPNNHLQYAFTWFGLAAALLGVGCCFLYARRGE